MNRPDLQQIPDAPGAYLFRDRDGRVVYVGKAKSLRKRIAQYFSKELHPRTQVMVETASSIEWIIADSEVAALMLEYSLIKQHRPRFNIKLRDDKSYPYLVITRGDQWPRARVMRGKKRPRHEYFGPYAHTYAIRKTLDLLLRTFPVRTCSDGIFRRQQAQGRPCLLYHIEKCSGPCVGAVEPAVYAQLLDGLARFLRGDTEEVISSLERRMWEAAERREYEAAARYRDRLQDVRKALERQEVVTDRPEDFDLMAYHGDDLEVAVQVLHVRRGRVVGRLETVVERSEDVSDAELVGVLLGELYSDESPPKAVLVPELPPDVEAVEAWLRQRRGGSVGLKVPRRGAKRRLLEVATTNAREAFDRHRLRRAADHNARARALRSLQEVLGLDEAPLRIEAYDVSTLQGSATVGSMVVMEDGLPRRSDYRRFRIRHVEGQDDFAAMEEVLRRRFAAYVSNQQRFRYPPSLVVVDGGMGQLNRAVKVLDDLDLDFPVIGLAKRMEEVYVPGRANPLRIPRDAEALYLLQQIRDEAHRFAVTYHRTLRSKRMVDSILDDVPGIGPARKRALLRRFGSLKRLRQARLEELAEVVPGAVASALYAALHGR